MIGPLFRSKLFTAALVSIGSVVSAGAQTFDLRIDPYDQLDTEGGWSIETNAAGDHVVIASAGFQDTASYVGSAVTSISIDPEGNVLQVDRVIQPLSAYPGWSNSTDRLQGGGFIVGGNIRVADSLGEVHPRAALFRADDSGTFQDTYELPWIGLEEIGRQAKQTQDGGFVICGETVIDQQSDAFIIKSNPQGQQEWMKIYGGPWNDYVVSLDRKILSGYYSGGQHRITSSNMDLWVQALDDTGGVIWEKIWGSSFNEPNAHLTTANDGHPLIASGWGYNGSYGKRHYLAKLNEEDGEFIWQREYGPICGDCISYVIQEITPGGDLIAAGSARIPEGQYSGTLLRTTSSGDSLWMRYYQYSDSLITNNQGIFRDVQPTPDGGFIACGSLFPIPGIYSQDVWVVKVDQHGCLEPGCHLITGMETQITNMRDALRVWPNPVQADGQVQVQLELPERFSPQGDLRIMIISSDGRLVHEVQIGNSSTPQLLNYPQLSSGLYHIHLTDAKRWISWGEIGGGVKGTIVSCHGLQRGDHPVLNICAIPGRSPE